MTETEKMLMKIMAELISQREYRDLGHRIIYDTKTGMSLNIPGTKIDISLLNEEGYQVKL